MNISKLHISGKERKELIRSTESYLPNLDEFLPKKGSIVKYTFSKTEALYIVDQKSIVLVELDNLLLPHLKTIRNMEVTIPKIVVDIGAIKFVTNGADIMRPGIVEIDDDVMEGGLVLVVEERNQAPLSIGRSLYDAIDMRSKDAGKCIKNLHWLKDKWFDFEIE